MIDLEWMPVTDSSRITAMAYDSTTETIFVQFPDGVQWQYESCPPIIWDEFRCSSKGTYISQVLNHRPNSRVG